jgi:hypothetical protein
MSGMILFSCLSLDQVRHPPGGPQPGAISQGFGTCFEAPAQLFQLCGKQARLAASPTGPFKRLGAIALPSLVPSAGRLAMDVEFAGHLGLAQALVEELGGFEPPLFQLFKIALDAFRITHAQTVA